MSSHICANVFFSLLLLFFLKHSFGAKIRSLDLGIIYNDQMFDAFNPWVNEFHLQPDGIVAKKRPMSLASPTIILDKNDKVNMVIGAAGGKYIATTLAQVTN